ncbi:methyl-accepting chemotaxis protein [Psychromonas sp. Urea-02u-13]|uniref:methyl-accepting chemotaxis protein n=1 Tax=Psychromonas sp. Urea-02u-13 TaxID=2058326 RepID=UPI000C3208B2|nr:methyl-accepting chemotaxis protein [Psychromonas sp. Urea-02u-13]PKG37031.1 methyl-accepting chemotaxis protein [Psychromonas sp. Urea-02u-13]
MNFFNFISIRHRLVIAMLTAVVISTSVVGIVGHSKAKDLLVSRLQQSDLPNLLQRVRNAVDGDISQMKVLTKSIATNAYIIDWLENDENSIEQETNLIKTLNIIAKDNGLSNASFSDRKTAKYWNQNGFLRVLKNDGHDGWFFAFKNSGQVESASLYTEKNGDVNVFVNYQDLNGRGFSGVSKSFNDMVNYLNSFKIEQTGFVYLVDKDGLIKVHKDNGKSEKMTVADIYPSINVHSLFTEQGFKFQETDDLIIASSYIPSLDWYVIAEVPKAELYIGLNESRNYMLICFAIIVLVFGFISLILAKSLTRPINELALLFEKLGQGEGDLSYRLNNTGSDEVSRLARGFDGFISNIHAVVCDVSSTSKEMREASLKVSSGAEKSRLEAQEQRDIAAQVATAISEMGSTISEIAANATNAADATNQATSQAEDALVVVQQSTLRIDEMAQNMESVSGTIESLASRSNNINSVLDVIRSISEQTNLLALNAAIEAARAGEQGRGFAVVADEVRSLAQRASKSTDEIHQMITLLQNDSKLAVDGVRESREKAELGLEGAKKTNQALNEIVENIQQLSDLNTQVATATEEQSAVVNEINIHVHAISDSTESSATTAEGMATSSESLSHMAKSLDSLVARFKI